jgi:hypothetical protein
MKIDKGLIRDTRPHEQPAGSYPYAKNGILHDNLQVMQNEPGFRISSSQIPYKTIGIIETSKHPVIFSTNGVNSAIGYFNEETDTYEPIIDDAALAFKLGFLADKYITGCSQSNYLGEIVCAFTDKTTFPKYINCDTPDVSALDDLRLFPLASFPDIELGQDAGGSNFPGAYYFAVK